MDPADPRARRVAAAARSPFPALRRYAQEALAEPEERGYFTDPESTEQVEAEQVEAEQVEAEQVEAYQEAYRPEPEEPELEAYAPEPYLPPQPQYVPPPPPPPSPPPPVRKPPMRVSDATFDEPPPPARPLYQDVLLAAAVSCVAFFAVRPLVPAPKPLGPPAVVPWQLTDRSGGTLEATVGAAVTSLPPNTAELAVEIPLPDWPAPVASASAIPVAAGSPAPATPKPKRVGVWLTVQSPAELAQIYTALARHHLERENWDQARYYADKVLGTWPDNSDARRLRDAARKGLGVSP